ncbi:hypothetical protein [Vibrio jasicida]
MMRLSEVNTAGIENGARLSAKDFQDLVKKGALQQHGVRSNHENSKPKEKKSRKSKNRKQHSGVELPWYCLYLKERCRLEADIQLLESDKEYYYQVSVMLYVSQTYPFLERLVHASPNGGNRTPTEGMRLKCAGALKGIPDIQFMVAKLGFHGLYIEMKKLPSDYGKDPEIALREVHLDQHLVREALLGQGYLAVVCYGVDEAISVIKAYMEEQEVPVHILRRWDQWDWRTLAKRDEHQKAA